MSQQAIDAVIELHAEVQKLHARIVELEADAARYRAALEKAKKDLDYGMRSSVFGYLQRACLDIEKDLTAALNPPAAEKGKL
jgi:hypothetical protein